jgi:hypothetical protein
VVQNKNKKKGGKHMVEIGQLVIPVLMNMKDFIKGCDTAQKKSTGLNDNLAKIGGAAVAGGLGLAATGIGALTAGVVSSIGKTTEWAGTLDGIQDIIGGSAEEAAGLATMVERVGGSSDQVTGAMKKLSMGLVDASGELGPTGLALQQLGISAFDSNGKLKSSYDLFGEIANATAGMDDGLGKSQILMDVFGKSGAELGDILSAASNGGMKAFQTEAINMGLAMDPGPSIEMEKSQAKLDQTMAGLQVTAGTALIPVMTELSGTLQETLADPEVKQGIKDLTKGAGGFLTLIVKNVPGAIKFLKQIPAFFNENKPIVAGVLAALGVAFGAFVYTTIIPGAIAAGGAFIAMMAPLLPAIAVMALVGGAVYLLYKAFDTNFLGLKDTVTGVWAVIEPIFNWIGDLIGGYVTRQFENFTKTIETVKRWFDDLATTFSSLTLPDWLKAGSPPEIWYSLNYMNKELKDMVGGSLPSFNTQLELSGASGFNNVSTPTKTNNSTNNNRNSQEPTQLEIDYNRLGNALAQSLAKYLK